MPKFYDDTMKKLLRANAQDFVALISKGLRVEELLPTELDAEHIFADGLVKCIQESLEEILAHFEFQVTYDERIGERLLEYNVFASRLHDYLVVKSCVICLKKIKDDKLPVSPFIKKSSDGEEIIRFHYKVICIWKITAEELLAMGLPGLLPLLPLTKGGKRREVVDIMVERLVEAQKTELIWIGYALAAKTLGQRHQGWLDRRFAMLSDFLQDSRVYQELFAKAYDEGMQKGMEQGMEQGMERGMEQGMEQGIETGKMQALSQTRQTLGQGLLDLVSTRFPALEVLARACVNRIDNTDILSHVIVEVGMAKTEQGARSALESKLL